MFSTNTPEAETYVRTLGAFPRSNKCISNVYLNNKGGIGRVWRAASFLFNEGSALGKPGRSMNRLPLLLRRTDVCLYFGLDTPLHYGTYKLQVCRKYLFHKQLVFSSLIITRLLEVRDNTKLNTRYLMRDGNGLVYTNRIFYAFWDEMWKKHFRESAFPSGTCKL